MFPFKMSLKLKRKMATLKEHVINSFFEKEIIMKLDQYLSND